MDLIVAVSRRWGIGNGKDLLFHLKEDLRFFRRMTLDKTVILGRRTLDSFPGGRPLPRRRHLVLSRDPSFAREGTEVFSSPEAVLEAVRDLPPDEVFVIGGGEIYRRFLPYCRRAWVTLVEEDRPASVTFPNLYREDGWRLSSLSDEYEEDGVRFRFACWTREAPHAL